MRTLLLSLLLSSTFVSYGQSETFFDRADSFFQKYCEGGRVDYAALHQNVFLNELIDEIANRPLPVGEEKAYLINVYNLFVIHAVANAYPISSPMEDPAFFDAKNHTLNGKLISLDYLENTILRKEYSDPRLHFALVCGAVSCPPIVHFAYRPEQLDEQLNVQVRLAVNDETFVYTDTENNVHYISEIFKWYSDDFGGSSKSTINYINAYRSAPLDSTFSVKFYPYNWTLNGINASASGTKSATNEPIVNLQQFTAGSLLGKGKMDFTLFNTLYTENHQLWQGTKFSGYRATFVTHLFQFTVGTSKSKRINFGIDVNFRSSGRSVDSTAGGIRNAFLYTNTDSSRVGITSIGPRIKLQPFAAVPDFSLQSTVLIPTINDPEGRSASPGSPGLYWADWSRITWWNQFFVTKSFDKFQLFTEADLLFRFRTNNSQIGMLDLPVSAFLSYFPTKKVTFYAMTQHVHRFTNNIDPTNPIITDWVIPANYTASGAGFKYQLKSNLNIELLYTNFWRGRNSGLGNTFNVGIKYLTR